MNNTMKSFLSITLMTLLSAQTGNIESLTSGISGNQPLFNDLSKPAIPLEGEIDPNEYLLGPGDQLHIVVTSLENKMLPGQAFDLFIAETIEYYEFIGPAGELTLPSIGQFLTTGKTYQQIKDEIISAASIKSYKKIQTTVRLASIRTFKIQVLGAVEYPGFVVMSPTDRVRDAIVKTKGIQKYGSNEIVYLERNGNRTKLFLKDFLVKGDLTQNPTLLEGDKIIVPFIENKEDEETNFTEYKTSQIIVHGFVRRPRGFSYVPGYKASDYIAMVGGVLKIGNENNTIIYRADGSELQDAYDEFVEPGDVVFVPESLRSRMFGNISILQTATAIATLYLTFIAATTG
ncbi:MAG: polysaccharide biosynthesis/export family protein [Candidatus Marinimicrobia bacterium]|nr:polysaccharide biosynthesis/export family protein [Candidatus Neomarinimicrobiota bacterium]